MGENKLFLAPFVPSPPQVVRQMLLLAEVRPGEIIFDLGAGDGRTVIMAAKDFSARAVGVELRDDLVKKALNTVYEQNLQDRITMVNGDMLGVDLSSADIVFLYLTTSANEKIRPKLDAELKRGVRIVSHDYEVVGWKPVKIVNYCENQSLGFPSHTLYLYKKG
jgi:predicted RNA methylase